MKWIGWAAAAAFVAASSLSAGAKEIELLRRADIGTSQLALDVLKKFLATKKFELKETIFTGSGDDAILKTIGASPPAAALVNGDEILRLADQRKLGDITANALADQWRARVLLPVQPFLLSNDRWVAAPLDVLPTNGLWVNSALMSRIGGVPPESIGGLFALLTRAKQAGVTPLAIGHEPRDIAALFDQVLMATGGPLVYKRVFVDFDEQALRSDVIKEAFENLARLRTYVGDHDSELSSKEAAQKVIAGEALAYVGPGSTRLLFAAAKKTPYQDYQCFRFPGTEGSIIYQLDMIAMLRASPDQWDAQSALADAAMDPQVQVDASLARGAVPVRGGVDKSRFDGCASKDITDVQQAAATASMMGSVAYGFLERASVTAAYIDVVTKFYRGELPNEDAAADALYSALTAGR
jgi:glucose/mannose transport system substrate-binding protein